MGMCYAMQTSLACAVIRACVRLGCTLEETIKYVTEEEEYDAITEEYITEKYEMYSSNNHY